MSSVNVRIYVSVQCRLAMPTTNMYVQYVNIKDSEGWKIAKS